MGDTDLLAGVAALLGEPARTRILTALLTGCALTAKELAYVAGVTAPTASSHLSRLVAGQLLVMEKHGRCHYYRLTSAEVARAIEGLMTVASAPDKSWPRNQRIEPALREARMCYDHLAGRLGVSLCDMMLRSKYLVLFEGGGELTGAGTRFLARSGSISNRCGAQSAATAAPVSIGPNDGTISPAPSGPPWRRSFSSTAGSRGGQAAVP